MNEWMGHTGSVIAHVIRKAKRGVREHPLFTASAVGMICFILGLFVPHSSSPAAVKRTNDLFNRDRGGFQYTNPVLACGDIVELSVGKIHALKEQIQALIDRDEKIGKISSGAVYVRDLDNGPWISINSDVRFYPASLLKLPLVFAAYVSEEQHPGFLDRTVTYPGPVQNSSYLFPPAETLEKGKSYTLRELVRRSLVYSDNDAATLLGENVGFGSLVNVFTDFGMIEPKAGQDYQMTVNTYASFFRVLYNASYLNRKDSEELLKVLSGVDFKRGIVSGVPVGTVVSHKFGEREGSVTESGNVQVHDCGIVYIPNHPYLICVMAQAPSTAPILEFMRTVSEQTFKAIQEDLNEG